MGVSGSYGSPQTSRRTASVPTSLRLFPTLTFAGATADNVQGFRTDDHHLVSRLRVILWPRRYSSSVGRNRDRITDPFGLRMSRRPPVQHPPDLSQELHPFSVLVGVAKSIHNKDEVKH